MELHGKRALVLGGTSGIGAGVVHALLEKGVHVVSSSRTERAAPVQSRSDGSYRFLAADARDPEALASMVRQAGELLGGLDMVVHSVGGGCSGSVTEVDLATWLDGFDIHVHSAFHLARAAVPIMRRSGGGAFVLVSSAAAYRAPADAIGYSTVKAAQIQFARCLSNDLAKDNIRVNCISPGFIATPYHDKTSPAFIKNLVDNRIPLHRIGQVDEVVNLLLSVATNEYVTGQSIVIDGGLNMSYR